MRTQNPFDVDSDVLALEMVGYVMQGDVTRARYVPKRGGGEAHPELDVLTTVVAAHHSGDKGAAYAALKAHTWSEGWEGVGEVVISALQELAFARAGKAYSSVSVARIAEELGISEEEAVQQVPPRGWRLDEGGAFFIPPLQGEAGAQDEERMPAATYMAQITDHIVNLES